MDVDFQTGLILVNGERHTTCRPADGTPTNPCASAWSHFTTLEHWIPTNSEYTSWSSSSMGPFNNDPWYYTTRPSPTEAYVKLCSTQYC